MLIKKAILEGIKAGTIDLAFRRWRRPTVKSGGSLKTAVGVLDVKAVDEIDPGTISDKDARRAGFRDAAAVRAELGSGSGAVYRIALRFAGKDPRIALREREEINPSEFAELLGRLRRMDSASRAGAWTLKLLRIIERHPRTRAAELADKTGFDTQRFKLNVRKLKNLGLTISHHPGYELSPRGAALLRRLGGEA